MSDESVSSGQKAHTFLSSFFFFTGDGRVRLFFFILLNSQETFRVNLKFSHYIEIESKEIYRMWSRLMWSVDYSNSDLFRSVIKLTFQKHMLYVVLFSASQVTLLKLETILSDKLCLKKIKSFLDFLTVYHFI